MAIDWAAAMDIERAFENVRVDLAGDWYRDPWGWPEIGWVASDRPDLLIARFEAAGVGRAQPIDVAKSNFGNRPAMILDPIDRLAYQALVDSMSLKLIGEQPPTAFGWRLPVKSPKRGVYDPNNTQWTLYRGQLNLLSGCFRAGLKTDVVSCFASIPIERLEDKLHQRCGAGPIPTRIMNMLRGWQSVPNRKGLPQRSFASAVLANMYLREVDDVLTFHGASETRLEKLEAPSGRFARWMDDIYLFGDDQARLRRAQHDLEDCLRSMGLDMNTGKTEVLEGEALLNDARQIDHSAVDDDLFDLEPTFEPLHQLLDRILAHPETANGTSIAFASTRMRHNGHFEGVDELIKAAPRMPHGAVALSRLFRDAGKGPDLEHWFIEYCNSPWMTTEWPAAQYGTVFPRDQPMPAVAGYFERVLAESRPTLPLLAVAADRLAAWDPTRARVAIRENAKRADTPLERRVLAFAALQADEERAYVNDLLGEFEDNAIALEMLRERKFRKLSLVTEQ